MNGWIEAMELINNYKRNNMDYDKYSTGDSSVPIERESHVDHTYGSDKTDVYDWMSGIVPPAGYQVCNITEVKFKGSRKEFYLNSENTPYKTGDFVVVGGNMGGYDIGRVSLSGELVQMQLNKKNVRKKDVIKKIYRKARPEDIAIWKLGKDMELDTLYKARRSAKDLGLSMKISDVDYQGDKTKATFYYTSDGRVDFRELIKHLSKIFQIHVEMRQIGLREEVSRVGNIGPCGSFYCCHTWSTNFKTDSPFPSRHQNNYKRQNNKFECYIKDEKEKENKDSAASNDFKAPEDNKAKVEKVLSFENVVGQDNINRFDNKKSKSKNNNRKNKKRKPQ